MTSFGCPTDSSACEGQAATALLPNRAVPAEMQPRDVGKPGRTGKCSGKDATPFSLAQLYADLRSAVHAAGDQKAFADLHGISPQYVSDVLNARKDPGPAILRALGLRKITAYERIG